MSIVFDQAVSYYDRTRADPEWVLQRIMDSLVDLGRLTPASRVLEIGVGTGRIAVPALKRGYSIIGEDLSLPMMGELQKKIEGCDLALALTQADVNVLPFPDSVFDCAYAVHVFHLVSRWKHALVEAKRVIKPGGVFLVSYHLREPDSPNRRVRRKLFELAKEYGVNARRPGAQSYEELKAELDRQGKTQLIEVARWIDRKVTVSQILDELEARYYSETWAVPEHVMSAVMPALRAWARHEFGDLTREIPELSEFAWIVARK